MQRVELLSQIEEQLGGDVEESQLAGIYTVRDLVEAVLQSAASGAGGPGTRTTFAGWKTILAEDPDPAAVFSLVRPQRASAAFWYMVSRSSRWSRSTALICTSAAWRSCPRAVLTLFLPIMKAISITHSRERSSATDF